MKRQIFFNYNLNIVDGCELIPTLLLKRDYVKITFVTSTEGRSLRKLKDF